MNLSEYILEYVSSGRRDRNRKPVVFTNKDNLNDWISNLKILGFDVENEEDQKDPWKWRDGILRKQDENENVAIVLFQNPTDPERLEPKKVVFNYNKKIYKIYFDKDGKIEPKHHFYDPSLSRVGYFFIDTNKMIDILNKDIENEYGS